MSLKAVIFDFDGVILDSEPLHYKAFLHVASDDGIECSWEEYVKTYIGFDDRDLFRTAYASMSRELTAAELAKLMQRKARYFVTLLDVDPLPVYEGFLELYQQVRSRYKIAICSGALRSDIEPVLKALDLLHGFDAVVTAEDVLKSKPDPSCYELTQQMISMLEPVDANEIVVIEDTPTGISAGKGAGFRVLAVEQTHPARDLSQADTIYPSLASLELAHLEELCS